ncbi:MAG: type I secretion system permease/ATPase [Pseudomonadota bacterium]
MHPNDAEKNLYRLALRPLRRTFLIVGLLSAAVNLLMLTGPMFMLQVYDRVLASGSFATLQGLFIIVVVLYVFLGLYDFLRARMLSRAAYRLDQTVGKDVFDRWVRSGLDGAQASRRPLNDLAVVRGFLSSPAMMGIFDLPWMPFYLVIVFLIHPWLGFLALAGAGVVTVLALLNQFTTRKHFARAMAMDAVESGFVEQSRRNADAILPLGMLDNVKSRWAGMHGDGLATGQDGGERAEGYTAASKAFRLLLQSALLALGGYLALQAEISPGMIVAASIIAGRALAPVDQVIGQWRSVVRAREAHSRIRDAMENTAQIDMPIALPDPKGFVDVVDLTRYAPGGRPGAERKPILDRVTFHLKPGDGLGVIGPSASGKSTLARLLVGGWQPEAGSVRLDGATLEKWATSDLGRHIGYLPQALELMPGSVRENIARFRPDVEDEDVIAAATLAGVHEMILALPEGYETRCGPGFHVLSGGQVQRIGLARALFGSPALVVLDEPNAHLDAVGDEALSRAIMHMREAGRTVIVMAHRPSAIAAVNKVLVLQEGRMVQFGDKAEVLKAVTTKPRVAEPAA